MVLDRSNRAGPFRGQIRNAALMVAVSSLAVAAASPALAAPTPNQEIRGRGGRVGVGVSLGDPMGGSVKVFLKPNHALQFDLGWAPLHHGDGRVGADYLWHPATLASNSTLDLVPYIGLGVGMGFWARRGRTFCRGSHRRGYCDGSGGGVAMLLRAPIVGLGIHWKGAPLDTMLEGSWAPYIVLPDLAHGDVSFKLRYYF